MTSRADSSNGETQLVMHPLLMPGRLVGRPGTQSPRANGLDGTAWLRNSISIWSNLSRTEPETRLHHPAAFPVALAERLIASLTRPSTDEQPTVVLDPFCGTGSTLVAAEAAGHRGIGIEVSPKYVKWARSRPPTTPDLFAERRPLGTRQVFEADARDLLEHVGANTVDLVVTSPPYWDILDRQRTADRRAQRNYGAAEQDLGHLAGYQDFLDAVTAVFAAVLAVMRPGAHCCVVVMDLRKGPRFYPLHQDLAARLQDLGLSLEDIIIWDRRADYSNMRPLGYPSVFRVNKAHEYILLFQKEK